MKIVVSLIGAVLLSVVSASSQGKSDLPSRETVREAIETFCKSPLSPEGKAAGDGLMRFYGDRRSTNYAYVAMFPEFHVTQRQLPNVSRDVINALNRGSLAGNLRPQLKDNVIGNRPYEGLQQMLKTYAQLKEADKTLKIPKLEEFAEREAKGQLRQHVEDIIKKKNYPTR